MPRLPKVDEQFYEKTDFSSKIFMYCSPEWNVLYPIVEVIRILKSNTIIGYMYGKGQRDIKTYSQQYNHRILGYNLENKRDYNELLRTKIKFIFIFNDGQDPISTNLINFSNKNNLVIVCYSNIDECYHFQNTNEEVIKYKTAKETVDKMYTFIDKLAAQKFESIFPDFDLIEPEQTKNTTLEECIDKLKQIHVEEKVKKDSLNIKLFDPHIAKIKAMEYQRAQKKIVYEGELGTEKPPNVLSKFFKTSPKQTHPEFKIKI
jgi:hypothetical protein